MRKSHRFQGSSTLEIVETVRKAKEKKFVKLALFIVLAFVCCWLPFAIQATVFLYWGKYTGDTAKKEDYFMIPILLNSIINPFVYFQMMNKVGFCIKSQRREKERAQ